MKRRSPAADATGGALRLVRDRGHIGIRLGLERMRALLARLDDPQDALRGALIGGTNGKGSVQALVAGMLLAGGHRVLQSPSPHLASYRERVTIDGQPVGAAALDALLADCLAASEPGEREHGPATQFELLTAAAFLGGARAAVDVAVVEVGLGGRLDATNTWDGGVAAITTVGLDHREYLGDTHAAVAAEKAAIIGPGDRAVTGATGDALVVIEAHCRRLGAPLTRTPPLPVVDLDRWGTTVHDGALGDVRLGLLGRFQAANAAVAFGVMDALAAAGIADVADADRRAGAQATRWPGRMELLEVDGVTVLLDGAHNPDGARTLAATVGELLPGLPSGRVSIMLGVMADKDAAAMIAALCATPALAGARFIASAVPDTERTMPAAALAASWDEAAGTSGSANHHHDPDRALEALLAGARADGGLAIVAGSLYLVGHVRARLRPDEHALDR